MSWLRIDDEFTEHPKVLLLTDAALAFWVKVGCWLQRNPKFGGFIPATLLPSIARKPLAEAMDLAVQLVNATAGGLYEQGLWLEVEGGYRVHDWEDYQLSQEELEERRNLRAEAGRLGGLKSGQSKREAKPKQTDSKREANAKQTQSKPPSKRVAKPYPIPDPDPVVKLRSKDDDVGAKDLTGTQDLESSDAEDRVQPPASAVLAFPFAVEDSRDRNPTRPDNQIPEPPVTAPERPVAASEAPPAHRTSPKPPKPKPERFVPDDFAPSDAHRAKARELGISIDRELQSFRCHEFRVPKTDWNRAFHGWLLRAGQSGTSSGGRSFSRPAPRMGEPGWRRQPDAGAVNDADYEYDYSQDEVSNG